MVQKVKIKFNKTKSKFIIRFSFVLASFCMLVGNCIAINMWGIIASILFLLGNVLALISYLKN